MVLLSAHGEPVSCFPILKSHATLLVGSGKMGGGGGGDGGRSCHTSVSTVTQPCISHDGDGEECRGLWSAVKAVTDHKKVFQNCIAVTICWWQDFKKETKSKLCMYMYTNCQFAM